jgi:hypothetical protein
MEILMTVMLIVCMGGVAFQIPNIMKDLATLLTVSSAEATARDLAGLITISGAASDAITLTYEAGGNNLVYDIKLQDRIVDITNIRYDTGEVLRGVDSPIKTGQSKTCVDPTASFEGVKSFVIDKARAADCNEYGVCDSYKVTAYR